MPKPQLRWLSYGPTIVAGTNQGFPRAGCKDKCLSSTISLNLKQLQVPKPARSLQMEKVKEEAAFESGVWSAKYNPSLFFPAPKATLPCSLVAGLGRPQRHRSLVFLPEPPRLPSQARHSTPRSPTPQSSCSKELTSLRTFWVPPPKTLNDGFPQTADPSSPWKAALGPSTGPHVLPSTGWARTPFPQ